MFPCPYCEKATATRVIESRFSAKSSESKGRLLNLDYNRRRRFCKTCNIKFTTVEIEIKQIQGTLPEIKKFQAEIKKFQAEKAKLMDMIQAFGVRL